MMKNGTMRVKKNGEVTALDRYDHKHRTMVMIVGTVKMKDGTITTMKNGDCVYMDGNWIE